MMMVAMQGVNKFSRSFTICGPMKKKPVSDIFEKRPEKYSPNEGKRNSERRIIQPGAAVIEHVNDHGKVHAPDYQGMCLSQHLQKFILEQTRLAFIMNFFKMHVK